MMQPQRSSVRVQSIDDVLGRQGLLETHRYQIPCYRGRVHGGRGIGPLLRHIYHGRALEGIVML